MSLTFNPPPGWPTPPEGWRPSDDWRPDPAWPAAPDGWQFWVDGGESTIVLPVTAPGAVRRPRRAVRAALVSGAAVALFALGLVIGQGNSGRVLDEARTLTAAAAEDGEAVEAERAAIDEERAALDTARAEAEAVAADLEERETAVAARESEITGRETAVVQQETDVSARLADVESREGALAQAEADLAAARSQPRSVEAPPPATSSSPSTSFENCDAARAAGAAPLFVGEPGYAKKLDRDGDGVACE